MRHLAKIGIPDLVIKGPKHYTFGAKVNSGPTRFVEPPETHSTPMKSTFLKLIYACVFALATLVSTTARAEDAREFVEQQHIKLTALLKQPASASRDAQVSQVMAVTVDYDTLVLRTFTLGKTDLWATLTPQQRAEVSALLRKLVEKNYKSNLTKTLDFAITYKDTKEQSGDIKVRTEAKSKVKVRDPAFRVDYLVSQKSGSNRVVDIVTEGSSLTKNYYDQFLKMMTTPGQGYPYMIQKLKEKTS